MRLIDADKLQIDCMADGKFAVSQSQIANAPTMVFNTEIELQHIENTLEPKKGKWQVMTDGNGLHPSYFCSVCGTQEGKPYNFCPNCGADMRGEA